MPAGVDMTWRGVRPLLPGVVGRLSAPAAATPATRRPTTLPTRRHHTLLQPPICATCASDRPRRPRTVAARPLLHYSTASKSSDPATASTTTISYQTMAKDLEDKRQREIEERLRQQQASSASSAATASPGTLMMDSMTRDPYLPLQSLQPPPSKTTSTSSTSTNTYTTARPTATSALTKPIIHHTPPNENERSRKHNVKSVVRQGRLEIMRQMQGLQMVDWRQVLRRLAMSTPQEEAHEQVSAMAAQRTVLGEDAYAAPQASPAKIVGWHKNAVLFAFSPDSPSVTELVHGVDDSMWSIWSRTSCVLKLFHWQGSSQTTANGLDFAHRPWLLSISGASEASISRAVLDVVRFAKDAEAIALGPSDLAYLDDMWTTAAKEAAKETETEPEAGGPWKLESSSYFYDSKYREDPVFQPYVSNIGAHEIPRPETWTPDSFERYVAALVNGTPPPQLATKIYHEQRVQDNAIQQQASLESLDSLDSSEPPLGTQESQETADGQPSRPQPIAPSHSRTVINLLHSAFHDEQARPSVSLSAFKMALAYMCRFGEANRPDVRTLFTRVEELGIPMDTETFNIILASHVKSQDVRNYGSTLRLMRSHRHGHTPDLTTWLLFLRLFWSEEVKRHILHTMFAKGLLGTSRAVRLVALEMAEHDAQQAVLLATSSKTLKTSDSFMPDFLARQAQRYGPRWLSRAAANRILDVLAGHARFTECDELLAALQEQQDAAIYRPRRPKSALKRAKAAQKKLLADKTAGRATTDAALTPPPGFVSGLSLDTFTYNTVLTHCKVQSDLKAALVVLRRMEVAGAPKVPDNLTSVVVGRPWLPRIPPDSATYHLLFAVAWAQRLPHTMAVIWHYACLNMQTRHWILLRVSREMVELEDGRRIPLAYYLTGVDPDSSVSIVPPPRSASGHRPLHQAGLEMSTYIVDQYKGLQPAEPLSKVLQDAMDRDAAMKASPGADTASAQAPMKIRLRKRALTKEDEIIQGITSFAFMEIPVKWGAFNAIEYSR